MLDDEAAGVERQPFRRWISVLREDVVQEEYGYEEGEFTIYAEQWKPLWREGLSPSQAFKRALDGFAEERREQDRLKAENWARIQAEDAALRAHLSQASQGEGR